jgi:hypothetical protein
VACKACKAFRSDIPYRASSVTLRRRCAPGSHARALSAAASCAVAMATACCRGCPLSMPAMCRMQPGRATTMCYAYRCCILAHLPKSRVTHIGCLVVLDESLTGRHATVPLSWYAQRLRSPRSLPDHARSCNCRRRGTCSRRLRQWPRGRSSAAGQLTLQMQRRRQGGGVASRQRRDGWTRRRSWQPSGEM